MLLDPPHTVLLACAVSSPARSQLGPDDCVDNVTISMSEVILYVPPGTVCIECSVGGEIANDTEFQTNNTQINGSNIDESIERVVDGVLVVFDTESVFGTSSATDVRCMSVNLNASHSVGMYLESKSHYIHITLQLYESLNSIVFRSPVITGNTTLSKGDTLYLDCDTSNSRPSPRVEWLSPERDVVSNERIFEMTNIQGSAEGIYTCVATQPLSGATITVNVTVQCECQAKLGTCMSPDSAPVQNLMYFKLCIVNLHVQCTFVL